MRLLAFRKRLSNHPDKRRKHQQAESDNQNHHKKSEKSLFRSVTSYNFCICHFPASLILFIIMNILNNGNNQ